MALNVVEAQATMEVANLLGRQTVGIALFDVDGAFPSVEREWIWASLRALGGILVDHLGRAGALCKLQGHRHVRGRRARRFGDSRSLRD